MPINKFLWVLHATPHTILGCRLARSNWNASHDQHRIQNYFQQCECVRSPDTIWTSRSPTHAHESQAERRRMDFVGGTICTGPLCLLMWPIEYMSSNQQPTAEWHAQDTACRRAQSIIPFEAGQCWFTNVMTIMWRYLCSFSIERVQTKCSRFDIYIVLVNTRWHAFTINAAKYVENFCAHNGTPHLTQRIRFERLIFIVIVPATLIS